MGWATMSRPSLRRATERVGLAANICRPLSCRQANAISAAAGAFVRIMKNLGGAEAPEQLLPYLERKLAVSDHAGSVYRSVNRVWAGLSSGQVLNSCK